MANVQVPGQWSQLNVVQFNGKVFKHLNINTKKKYENSSLMTSFLKYYATYYAIYFFARLL